MGDEQLRQDLEHLLAEEPTASFRSALAGLAAASELTPGAMLGRYRVEAKLGQGGMGAVYKAYDTLLRRPVALKVLAAWHLADPESRQRLTREARAASALDHPNIVTIYDIGCERGVDFIAMEYVAGRSLDGLIGRKGVGFKDTLRYGIQTADALATAHAAGIVHREVKPGNVLVTEAGLVKVLDFGLAKAVAQQSGATAALTAEGVVMGTASYMSPEQAEGKPVDARSDIFSFGAVVYEMVTGRRAFQGDSHASTVSAILHQEPKPVAPPALNQIVVRCLRKDAARRFQHMDEVKAALEDIEQELQSPRWRNKALLVAVAVVAVVAAVIGWRLTRSAPDQQLLLTQITTDTGITYQPAISPDGNLIAYASDRSGEGKLDIWLQHLPRAEPIRLTREKGNNYEPSFSPDGGTIVFVSDREGTGLRGGGIHTVPSLGGEARKIAEVGHRPRFSSDGQWVAYWAGDQHSSGVIYVVPAVGGLPRQIPPGASQVRSPVWTPDGKHLLFSGVPRPLIPLAPRDWWVAGVDGGMPVNTGALEECQRANLHFSDFFQGFIWPDEWIPGTNEVLFSARSGDSINLWKVSLSPKNWKVQGPPQRLTFGAGPDVQASSSMTGRIVFSNAMRNLDIWSLPVDPNRGIVLGELQQLTHGAAEDHSPSISRDGKRMVFESDRTGKRVVWTKDLETGKERMLTDSPSVENLPFLSPDGANVVYWLDGRPKGALYVVPFSGGTLRKIGEGDQAVAWMPDGQRVLYGAGPPAHLEALDLATGERAVVVQHPALQIFIGGPAPGGGWVSFRARSPDQKAEEFVAPLRGRAAVRESEWIPTRGWSWSPDGNRMWGVLGLDGFRCIWTQRLDPKTKRMVGEPEAVYHSHSARRSLANVTQGIGLSVAADKVVFTMGELTGNIWMAERDPR